MTVVLVAVAALVLMEPVTALIHRFVMHGFAMGWHRSHHEPPRRVRRGERPLSRRVRRRDDRAPRHRRLRARRTVAPGADLGIGVTAYGAAYLLVHDVVIHRRLAFVPLPDALEAMARSPQCAPPLRRRALRFPRAGRAPRWLRRRAAERDVDHTRRTVSSRDLIDSATMAAFCQVGTRARSANTS